MAIYEKIESKINTKKSISLTVAAFLLVAIGIISFVFLWSMVILEMALRISRTPKIEAANFSGQIHNINKINSK